MLENDQLSELRKNLQRKMGVKFRRKKIKSITVNPASHSLPKIKIVVGKECRHLEPGQAPPEAPPEMVMAIFEATTFIVCTRNRGVEKGIPYFFAREDVLEVEIEE
jgi:hypothetical protein